MMEFSFFQEKNENKKESKQHDRNEIKEEINYRRTIVIDGVNENL